MRLNHLTCLFCHFCFLPADFDFHSAFVLLSHRCFIFKFTLPQSSGLALEGTVPLWLPVFPTEHSHPTLEQSTVGKLVFFVSIFIYFGSLFFYLISELGQLIMQLHVY